MLLSAEDLWVHRADFGVVHMRGVRALLVFLAFEGYPLLLTHNICGPGTHFKLRKQCVIVTDTKNNTYFFNISWFIFLKKLYLTGFESGSGQEP